MSVFSRLECNDLGSPLGIAVEAPRLSWQGPAATVRIYRGGALCCSSPEAVASPYRPDWIPEPQTAYRWTLDDGSAAGFFETALSDADDWSPACWLTMPAAACRTWKRSVWRFQTGFTLDRRPDAAVRLYISALGVYRARINGIPVGDTTLAPGAPDFYVRTLYQTYDVGGLLRNGDNTIAVDLASGWHSGAIARGGEEYEVPFYAEPDAVIARLDERTPEGAVRTLLASDATWQAAQDGPWLYSDIYMGEFFDATRTFREFHPAAITTPRVRLDARNGAPVRCIEELAPQSMRQQGGKTIVDFGQNLAGRERITCNAPRGARIVIRHGEMLQSDGALYTANLRRARTVSTIIAPGGQFTYEPEFTFYGFRYLEVSGVENFAVAARVLHSDLLLTGSIRCGNALLNRLAQNILWGQRGNFLDIPTDCPQRDERRGWLGDAQVFIPAALFNMHAASFFRKWLDDVLTSRDAAGRYPFYAPNDRRTDRSGKFGASGWADAGVVCPHRLYLMYGDRTILEKHAPAIYRWIDWESAHSEAGLCRHARFRDWLNLDAPTSEELISTAYFAYGAHLASDIADALGDAAAAERMRSHFKQGKAAFRRHFLNASGELAERTQCAAVMALKFHLLEGPEIPLAVGILVDDIVQQRDCHLSTGFLGTPLLLHALSENGRLQLAYWLLEQTTYPSWLYPVTQGATTVWERWNSWNRETGFGSAEMNSFNHYAYGAVADWIYTVAAGIRPRWATPGFREFDLAPNPGGTLQYLDVSYDSPAGLIRSMWQVGDNGAVQYHFTVPEGTRAHLVLPDGLTRVLPPGEHRLEEYAEMAVK